jgi:ABC-2 type transport system ATP-binding protein
MNLLQAHRKSSIADIVMVRTNSSATIVQAVGLTKTFKDFWLRTKAHAVDNIDFVIRQHEIFGLLGPNGSGKSTTIKMILGLLYPSRGQLTVFGKLPTDVSIKKRIGFLPEESYMYRFLNPLETLDYYGKLFNLDHRTRRRRIDELLDMVGLTQVAHRAVGEFSKGMTRRLGLAQALINDPDFLILDEPTSGLDPIGTRQVKDLLLELGRRGKTILLSSHLLADVEDVCDRMVVLYGGKIRAQGTTDELLSDTQRTIIQTPRLRTETITRIEQVLNECEHVGIEKVEAPRQRLEQLFMDIVEKARREQVATSGALHGGETARFLRGEAGEGEEVIGALLQDQAAPVRARAKVAPAGAKPAAPQASRDEVLSELLGKPAPVPPPVARPRDAAAADSPATPADVDSSIIDSLLKADDDRESPAGPSKDRRR